MRQILVPVDGSERSETILPWAAALAEATGTGVVLFRVVGMGELKEESMGWEKGEPLAQVQEYLAGLAEGFARRGIAAETAIGYRPEGEAIVKAASERDVDLIAMCTRLRPHLPGVVLGSTAREVFENTDRPLLLVRSIEGSDRWRGAVLKKILVPLDGSQRALSILPFVFELARSSGASLAFLHVLPRPQVSELASADAVTKMIEERDDRFLTEASDRAQLEGVEATWSTAVGLPVEGMIHAAKESDADMIVLCSQGAETPAEARELIESVLRSAEVPTLIMKPI